MYLFCYSFKLNKMSAPPSTGEVVYEPFENSLAVFKTVEGRYGLTFRKSSKVLLCNNKEGAYKMLKSLLVHFGELNDGKEIPVPAELKDVELLPIDVMEEGNLIDIFEVLFENHWTDVPSMKFKKSN